MADDSPPTYLPDGYAHPVDPVEELSLSLLDRVGRLAGLIPRTWRAFRDNPGLWGALKKIAYKEQRDAGFLSVAGWLMGKVLEPEVTAGRGAAKGFAKHVLESAIWLSAGLDDVPHLGVLDSLILPHVSRADYVHLCIGNLLTIKQRYPQLGLGSESGIDFAGAPLTNLEVAQVWAIALNMGHLFGTFATERALLFKLHGDRHLRRLFADSVQSEPAVLRIASD